jgi:hypothetical protein
MLKQQKPKTPEISVIAGIWLFFPLSRLGSNQNSSEPKSDVLPVTPRDSNFFENANV